MQRKTSFDFSRARNLTDRINTCRIQLSAALEELEREVTDIPAWWEGVSRDAFLDKYRRAAPEMSACLEVMNDTLRYITRVSNHKEDLEAKGKNRFG